LIFSAPLFDITLSLDHIKNRYFILSHIIKEQIIFYPPLLLFHSLTDKRKLQSNSSFILQKDIKVYFCYKKKIFIFINMRFQKYADAESTISSSLYPSLYWKF
jgi:hypothetical protein